MVQTHAVLSHPGEYRLRTTDMHADRLRLIDNYNRPQRCTSLYTEFDQSTVRRLTVTASESKKTLQEAIKTLTCTSLTLEQL